MFSFFFSCLYLTLYSPQMTSFCRIKRLAKARAQPPSMPTIPTVSSGLRATQAQHHGLNRLRNRPAVSRLSSLVSSAPSGSSTSTQEPAASPEQPLSEAEESVRDRSTAASELRRCEDAGTIPSVGSAFAFLTWWEVRISSYSLSFPLSKVLYQ